MNQEITIVFRYNKIEVNLSFKSDNRLDTANKLNFTIVFSGAKIEKVSRKLAKNNFQFVPTLILCFIWTVGLILKIL
ncbi:hypothetical protein [Cyclobacterium qasimii]|uniref:Uncharacterized protein n=2 Tax=Cyclobacterium qasimii TaxID=1350429 RepID=S7VNA5_9BACT|nr:hypothetical protein [Cyclobacterium qasimii]EPR71471.1 hypothetical protein ADICYQ_0373 [Cyclobacterium qasimii M12-11B]GEO23653.1 hypothetical protein CQA01_41870 [Cyclobacterium qasimii]